MPLPLSRRRCNSAPLFAKREDVIVDATTPSAPLEVRGLDAGSVCWCDASGGMVPPGAVEGGNDEETLFVGRAHHEGALIPGKVKPGHCVCYIPWGGAEHGKTDYQVSDARRRILIARTEDK